jgi:hypothetical protein
MNARQGLGLGPRPDCYRTRTNKQSYQFWSGPSSSPLQFLGLDFKSLPVDRVKRRAAMVEEQEIPIPEGIGSLSIVHVDTYSIGHP